MSNSRTRTRPLLQRRFSKGDQVLVRFLDPSEGYFHETGTVVTGKVRYMLQDEVGPRVAHLRVSIPGYDDLWEPVSRLQPAILPNAGGEVDEDAAAELILYIVNTAELYDSRSIGASVEKNLAKKWKSGKFNEELAAKGYMHLVDAGAKRYVKEFASGVDWHAMFNAPTRRLVAQEMTQTFVTEAKLGNFRG